MRWCAVMASICHSFVLGMASSCFVCWRCGEDTSQRSTAPISPVFLNGWRLIRRCQLRNRPAFFGLLGSSLSGRSLLPSTVSQSFVGDSGQCCLFWLQGSPWTAGKAVRHTEAVGRLEHSITNRLLQTRKQGRTSTHSCSMYYYWLSSTTMHVHRVTFLKLSYM